MADEELWKQSIEPNYEVSNLGRIRSKDRYVNTGIGGKRFIKGTFLKLIKANTGYYMVCVNGKNTLVHILVANAFIENPNNLPQINHKDTKKLNNFSSNLEWISCKDNIQHAYNNGCFPTGEKHYNSKLSNKQTVEIRDSYLNNKEYGKTEMQHILASKYKVSRSLIESIVNNKTRNHGR